MPTSAIDERNLRDTLAHAGRVTTQRLLCLQALHQVDGHLTGTEIADRVREDLPSIKLSTIYRTMARFLETGLVHRVDGFHGSCYGLGSGHAHVVCLSCDSVRDLAELDSSILEAMRGYVGPGPAVRNVTIQTLCDACTPDP